MADLSVRHLPVRAGLTPLRDASMDVYMQLGVFVLGTTGCVGGLFVASVLCIPPVGGGLERPAKRGRGGNNGGLYGEFAVGRVCVVCVCFCFSVLVAVFELWVCFHSIVFFVT